MLPKRNCLNAEKAWTARRASVLIRDKLAQKKTPVLFKSAGAFFHKNFAHQIALSLHPMRQISACPVEPTV